MAKHYNLYYLFLEDKNTNLMACEKRKQIKHVILDRYRETAHSGSFSSKKNCIEDPKDQRNQKENDRYD